MSQIAEAYVRLRLLADGAFEKDVRQRVERDVRQVERSLGGANREISRFSRGALVGTGALGQLGRAAAFASVSFIGGAGLIVGMKNASAAASNLNEQISKSGVVFGRSSQEIERWSKTSATSLGLARDQAIETAAGFGALLLPLGFTQVAAVKTSEKLTQLGADLASFSNTPVPDALAAIRSGLVGEIEPLRRYGVVLSEAAVQQEAMRATGKKTVEQLTAQEKVSARLALIFKQTTLAQGDFERTSGGLANQQRILAANLRDLEIILGQALNPEIQKIVTRLNEWLGSTENQERLQRRINEAVKTGEGIARGFATALGILAAVIGPLVKLVGGLDNAIRLLLIGMAVGKVAAFTRAIGTAGATTAVATLGTTAATSAAQMTILANSIGTGAVGAGVGAGVAGSAVVAATKVSALRLALLNLRQIAPIVIGIDVIFRGKKALTDDLGGLIPGGIPGAAGKIFGKSTADIVREARADGKTVGQAVMEAFLFGLQRLNVPTNPNGAEIIGGLPLPKNNSFVGRPLSAIEALRAAVSAAGLTPGTADDVRALTAQRAQYQKALDFALTQIRLQKGNTAQFARDAEQLSGDIAGINQNLAGIVSENVRKAVTAREKAIEALGLGRSFKGSSDAPGAFDSLRTGLLQGTLGSFAPGGRANVVVPGIPPELALRLQIAEQNTTNEKTLIPLLQTEAGIVANQLRLLKKTGATELSVLSATLDLATIRRRIRDIRKQDARDAFTTQDLFSEAGDTFAKYGPNVGDLTTALSPQEAGGAAVRAARTIQVTQVFTGEQPNPAQALQGAANAARALRYG